MPKRKGTDKCSFPGCEVTGWPFTIRKHYREVHEGIKKKKGTDKCSFPECEYTGYPSEVRLHYEIVHEGRKREKGTAKCSFPECEFTGYPSKVTKHYKAVHEGRKREKGPVKCSFPECEYTARRSDVKAHYKQVHEGRKRARAEKKFLCSWPDCKRKFNNRPTLAIHERSHETEIEKQKPYQCERCGNRFVSDRGLTSHLCSGVVQQKAFRCEACHREYARAEGLATHPCPATRILRDAAQDRNTSGAKPSDQDPNQATQQPLDQEGDAYLDAPVEEVKALLAKCREDLFIRAGLEKPMETDIVDGLRTYVNLLYADGTEHFFYAAFEEVLEDTAFAKLPDLLQEILLPLRPANFEKRVDSANITRYSTPSPVFPTPMDVDTPPSITRYESFSQRLPAAPYEHTESSVHIDRDGQAYNYGRSFASAYSNIGAEEMEYDDGGAKPYAYDDEVMNDMEDVENDGDASVDDDDEDDDDDDSLPEVSTFLMRATSNNYEDDETQYSEDEVIPLPPRKRARTRQRVISLSDDEDENDSQHFGPFKAKSQTQSDMEVPVPYARANGPGPTLSSNKAENASPRSGEARASSQAREDSIIQSQLGSAADRSLFSQAGTRAISGTETRLPPSISHKSSILPLSEVSATPTNVVGRRSGQSQASTANEDNMSSDSNIESGFNAKSSVAGEEVHHGKISADSNTSQTTKTNIQMPNEHRPVTGVFEGVSETFKDRDGASEGETEGDFAEFDAEVMSEPLVAGAKVWAADGMVWELYEKTDGILEYDNGEGIYVQCG